MRARPPPSGWTPPWVKTYRAVDFKFDLVAGLVAVMLLLPQSLAYALLAGLPPHCGLYASVLPLVAYAFFGTSRSLSVGPMAVTSLMTASAIAPLVAAGTGDAVTIALQLALLSGFMLMLCGVLRLGVIANLLSSPVNQGFMVGSAILIILGQVLPLLGLRGQGHTGWALLRSLSTSLSEINPVTALTGVTALALLLLSQHFLGSLLCRLGMKPATAGMGVKLVPMLIVVAGIGVTIALSLDLNHGVRVVGPLPQALPALVLPTLSLTSLEQLALPAGALALIGFISSVSVAQTLAQREQEQINPNREMLGLGASNVVAALAGGLPVTGGLSRSVVNYTAGARSPLSGVVSASLLVLILIQFSMGPYFARLPVCVLAASIIAPMLNVLEPRSFLRIWRYAQADGLSFLATALGVLIFGVEIGIALGIGLSLLTIIWQASHPHIALLGRVAGSEQFRNVERAAVELNPRILALRIDENLFFGNIGVVEAALATALEDQPDAQHVLLVLSSVNHIDATALERLLALNESLMTRHKLLHLAEVKGPVLDQLQRSRLPQILSGQVFRFTHEAFAALEAN